MTDKPHWAEELSSENLMLRTFNWHLLAALAKIANCNAQNGEDAMKMRNIAFAVLYPEKASNGG